MLWLFLCAVVYLERQVINLKFYQEITLIPAITDGVSEDYIWSELFRQIHLALASQMNKKNKKKSHIGVSFPQYSAGKYARMGNKLRLFANTKEELVELNLYKWLRSFGDYVHIRNISSVPQTITEFAIYKRYHHKGSVVSKAKRYAKRHNISVEQAESLFPVSNRKIYPFISIFSETDKMDYPLYVKRSACDTLIQKGFNSYGLDGQSSVPEF